MMDWKIDMRMSILLLFLVMYLSVFTQNVGAGETCLLDLNREHNEILIKPDGKAYQGKLLKCVFPEVGCSVIGGRYFK